MPGGLNHKVLKREGKKRKKIPGKKVIYCL